MNRLATTYVLITLFALGCGSAMEEPDPEPDVQPVETLEISAAAGRLSSATYKVDFQLGRGPITASASGDGLTATSATPLRSK